MKKWTLIIIFALLVISLTACGAPEEVDVEVALRVAETQTKMAWEASVESAQQTAEVEPSSET